jgi:hypothetical protein
MRFAPVFAALVVIATPALAQQGELQTIDHGRMVGMSHDEDGGR